MLFVPKTLKEFKSSLENLKDVIDNLFDGTLEKFVENTLREASINSSKTTFKDAEEFVKFLQADIYPKLEKAIEEFSLEYAKAENKRF